MATPTPLEGTFNQQPAQLADPVPNATAQPDNPFEAALANVPAPAPLEAPAVEEAPAEALSNPFEDALAGTEPEPIEEGRSFFSQNLTPGGIAEQLGEASTRFKNAFTSTDKESLDVLRSSGLFDDVQYVDGRLKVKRKGRKNLENFDTDKIELVGDTLDLTRMAFEGIVENIFRVGGAVSGGIGGAAAAAPEGAALGAAAGSVIPGAGTVVGGTVGGVTSGMLGALTGGAGGGALGGAAGAVTAMKVGDYVAEKLLDIPQDPGRDKVAETTAAGIMGGAFNAFSASRTRTKIRNEFRQQEAKKTVEHAKSQMDEATQAIEDVRSAGFNIDEGGTFHLDAHQGTRGKEANITATAKELSRQNGFTEFRRVQGEKLVNAYTSMIGFLGAKAGKADSIGKDFILSARAIQDAEGSVLGNVRKMGREAGGKTPINAPVTTKFVDDLYTKLGGKIRTSQVPNGSGITDSLGKPLTTAKSSFTVPSTEDILDHNVGLTETQAKTYGRILQKIQTTMQKGQGKTTVIKMEKMYNELTQQINTGYKSSSGTALAAELVPLKNAIRDEWTDMLEQVMPTQSMGDYIKAKDVYSSFKLSERNLRTVLGNEHISRRELIDKMFGAKSSPKFAESAKNIFQENDPKFWKQLTTEYFQKLGQEHYDDTLKVMDWKSIQSKWNILDVKQKQLLLEGSGMDGKGFKQLLNVGRIYQHTDFTSLPKQTKESIGSKLMTIAFMPFVGTKYKAAASLLNGIGQEESMMMWMKEGGMDAILKNMPHLTPTKRQAAMTFINDWTPSAVKRAGSAISAKTPGIIKSGVRNSPAMTEAMLKVSGRQGVQGMVSPGTDPNQAPQ